MPLPAIQINFASKKAKILRGLSRPDSDYSDKSPKGSVDEAIRELINEVNAYEGLVTTSSCAGRISFFQEGQGKASDAGDEEDGGGSAGVPGGKGGGKFLFVSHEPIDNSEDGGLRQLFEILGLAERSEADEVGMSESWVPGQRFVRFAFEPMILHIMTATLQHAKPVLSAAINSGFRESGVQSLKNLGDPAACPMVAVRTAGLGLEAIIASVAEGNKDGHRQFQPLVRKDYCTILLKVANERFEANKQRINKFRAGLREAMALEAQKLRHNENWESPEARRQRKRDQGLRATESAKANVLNE